MSVVRFRPGPTVRRYIRSSSRVRGIRGPIGSGKTSGSLWAMMNLIYSEPPMADGVRRSRWLCVRNSYRELADTTIKTFWDWFPPEALGHFSPSDMVQEIRGDALEAEILFRSLDKPGSIRKLLSLDLRGAFVNEARELPLEIIQMIDSRLGRYPAIRDGGAGLRTLLMDTNPPDVSHWWPEVFEREPVADWEQFTQPSGLSAEAENRANLPPRYYEDLLAGKSEEWINVYVHGKYGYLASGKPVFPEFQASVHSRPRIEWNGTPVYVGLDFGLTPAAAIVQRAPAGGLQVIGEIVTADTGAARFAGELSRYLTRYDRKIADIWGDPSGDNRAQTDEMTVFQVLRARGVPAKPAPSQDPLIRREALAGLMLRLGMGGDPALLVSAEACPVLLKGLSGFYRYEQLAVNALEPRHRDAPAKDKYSHICEALEYAAVGLGEGANVIRQPESVREASRRRQVDARRRLSVI